MEYIWKRIVVVGFVFVCLGFAGLCSADTIYFKNGRKLEGEVKRAPEGLWIEGGLFQENEIERIEKGPSSTEKKEEQPWYSGVLNRFGIQPSHEVQKDTQPVSVVQKQAQKKKVEQLPPQPSAMPLPLPFRFVAPQAQPGSGQQNFSAMIEQAQQIQNQVQQRQMMMQEMMRAEEGYPVEPGTGSAGKDSSLSVDTYDYSLPEYQKKAR